MKNLARGLLLAITAIAVALPAFPQAAGKILVHPYADSATVWTYAAATGGIVNSTTAVTIKAAAAAGLRNYVTSCQIGTDALGAATELAIRDGAGGTVLWRAKLGTAALPTQNILFPVPLQGSKATLLEIVTLTATTTGGVFVNCQGYYGP